MAYTLPAYHGPNPYSQQYRSQLPGRPPGPPLMNKSSATGSNRKASHLDTLSRSRGEKSFLHGCEIKSGREAWVRDLGLCISNSPHIKGKRPVSQRSRKNPSSAASSLTTLSSTPHAPRQKKPVPFLPQQRHGSLGHLPSTHSLIKQHRYLDEGLLRSLSSPSLAPRRRDPSKGQKEGDKPTEQDGGGGSVEGQGLREAWGEKCGASSVREPRVVKPFRRTFGRKAPEGVPLLDLCRLNEPDENMQPIELLSNKVVDGSEFSWGEYQPSHPLQQATPTPTEDQDKAVQDRLPSAQAGVESDLQVQDVTEETGRKAKEGEGEGAGLPLQLGLDASHFDFVEQKVLSHERGKPLPLSSLPSSQPQPHPHGTGTPPPGQIPEALRSRVAFGVGVAETALSRRVRFEARVLTQNGRDVHRELCGFFFLADSSITIYEFRQFGKKSSALPLIQRGVYTHPAGHRQGEPYQINCIRKGATLYFESSSHPSLPISLSSRPLLAIRVTNVDEKTKKGLLFEGRNPLECRQVEAYLSQPLPPAEDEEQRLLSTLQGMLCSRLRGRASRSLVGLGRQLRGSGKAGLVRQGQLQQALRSFHISLTQEDFQELWRLLTSGPRAPPGNEGVYVDCCIHSLVGGMAEDRKTLVRKVFQKLDGNKTGLIRLTDMHKFFNGHAHPEVLAGRSSPEEVWFVLFGYLGTRDQPAISYADFEHYYEGVSIETESDADFYSLLKCCWAV